MNTYSSFFRGGLALIALLTAATITRAADPAGSAIHLNRSQAVEKDAWRHQVYQNSINIDPEQNYLLTFWARSDVPTTLSVATKHSTTPWGFFGLRTEVQVNTEWKRYRLPFRGEKAIPEHSRLSFSYREKGAAQIWIADLSIRLSGPDGKDSPNLVTNPRFESGLTGWSHEGTRAGVYSVDVQTLAEVDAAVQATAAAAGN
jgi:hypothetical protein